MQKLGVDAGGFTTVFFDARFFDKKICRDEAEGILGAIEDANSGIVGRKRIPVHSEGRYSSA